MWKLFPYFGIQTGINYSEQGYSLPNLMDETIYETTRYQVLTIPVISQFHVDFWKMRLLVNIGAFTGYRLSARGYGLEADVLFYSEDKRDPNRKYVFNCYDKRVDFGFIGGGGLAFVVSPFEIHFECNYHYSLSMLYDPKIYSNTSYTYIYPHQLVFSLALHFQL
jgi:hypothetical protein